jgi:hypothetical protein
MLELTIEELKPILYKFRPDYCNWFKEAEPFAVCREQVDKMLDLGFRRIPKQDKIYKKIRQISGITEEDASRVSEVLHEWLMTLKS